MSENQGNGILAGFVIGAVVGAGLALLLAPASGSDTRQRLRDKAVELGGKTREFGNSGRDKLDAMGQAVREGSRDLSQAIQDGRDALKDGRDVLKDTASEVMAGVRRG